MHLSRWDTTPGKIFGSWLGQEGRIWLDSMILKFPGPYFWNVRNIRTFQEVCVCACACACACALGAAGELRVAGVLLIHFGYMFQGRYGNEWRCACGQTNNVRADKKWCRGCRRPRELGGGGSNPPSRGPPTPPRVR